MSDFPYQGHLKHEEEKIQSSPLYSYITVNLCVKNNNPLLFITHPKYIACIFLLPTPFHVHKNDGPPPTFFPAHPLLYFMTSPWGGSKQFPAL